MKSATLAAPAHRLVGVLVVFGLMAVGLGGCGPLPAREGASVAPATSSWHAIAEGVYEKTEPSGVITRLSVGAAGAEHTRQELEARVGQAEAYAREHSDDMATRDHVRALKQALEVATQGAKVGGAEQISITPESATFGSLCGQYDYEFQTGLVGGLFGATAVARTFFTPDNGFTPAPPLPTATTVVSTAAIQASARSPWLTVQNYSNSSGAVSVSAIQNLDRVTELSTHCQGWTSNQISISSPICPGGSGYVNLEQWYPGCQS